MAVISTLFGREKVEDAPEPEKQKGPGLFDFIDAISDTKQDPGFSRKDYVQYLVNRALMMHHDTLYHAQTMNLLRNIEPDMHYAYMMHSVSKRRRRGKWLKKSKQEKEAEELIQFIMRTENVDSRTAREIYEILDENEMRLLRARFEDSSKA